MLGRLEAGWDAGGALSELAGGLTGRSPNYRANGRACATAGRSPNCRAD